MLISEIYHSRQGEGLLTGTPSIFIRTSGCNLRCEFCDTPFASWSPEGSRMSVEDIANTCGELDASHFVLTGGEPMIQRELPDLCSRLKRSGTGDPDPHITIETAGTVFADLPCDLMSISPKLANSTPSQERAGEWQAKHESARNRPDVIDRLIQRYPYQLKYVVADPEDLNEIESHLDSLAHYQADRVLLMPEGVTGEVLENREQWLRPICEEKGFAFCPRMHIHWYGNKRGT